MIVTQPDRVLLAQQLARYAPKLRGALLDVGSGRANRYGSLFVNATSRQTLDADPRSAPDILASVEALPLADASVDSILCTQVLEHLPHPERALREMHRILRPQGYLLLTAPQWNELHEIPRDYFRYTCFGLRTLLEEAGFTIETMERRGGYHAAMMQMRIRYLIDRLRPYEHRLAMLFLTPVSLFLTRFALLRDRMTKNKAAKRHAIGWCVLARKL